MKKLLLVFLCLAVAVQVFAQQDFPFANEIQAFKHQDSISFPPKNGILFIGSSSIRFWTDLEQHYAGKPVIRRGVGGCELWQLVDYYTPYILFPYHPRKIFIYAGENDIAAGKSAVFVFDEYQKLFGMIKKELPDAAIYFLSIKLSPSRAKHYNDVKKANELIRGYMSNKANCTFVDMNAILFNEQTATPDSALFRADYLHLNPRGYAKWEQVVDEYVN